MSQADIVRSESVAQAAAPRYAILSRGGGCGDGWVLVGALTPACGHAQRFNAQEIRPLPLVADRTQVAVYA
ncbi:MAG: hypothetical protein ACXVCO_18705 [Ktedonobacterales bacterium]